MWSAFFPSAAPSDASARPPGPVSPVKGVPVAMTVAGSDNSAGAGMQADLKTFCAHGVYGLSSVTCVVSEVPGLVSMIEPLSPAIVADQIRLGFEAFPVAAVKTGMLYSREIIAAVAEALGAARKTAAERGSALFLVVDPVMVASSGDPLLKPDAVAAYKEQLFPLADLLTPNLDEAASLLGRRLSGYDELEPAAAALAGGFGRPVLLKGGHLQGPRAVDLLACPGGPVVTFEAPFFEGLSPHGTGCSYSAAIAARLAKGEPLETAVRGAKRFITEAIRQHLHWSATGVLCLNHGPALPPPGAS